MDKRHARRLKIIQELYTSMFPGSLSEENVSDLTMEVLKHTDSFDVQIEEVAKKYSVEKIAKVDISILRYALYELKLGKVPPKVIINEAVELAKELGSEKSPSFVNAVLGKIYDVDQPKNE